MDLLSSLALGFFVVVTPENLLYCLIGAVVGTLVGVLPGLGPAATISLLLPTTLVLSPVSSLIMLAGIYYGAQYGSSTTAILVNIPGEPSSVVTALEGHEMAKRGEAGPALAVAAIGSFIAGSFATLVVALFGPSLATIALKFGPAEYFSLMALGLVCSVVLATGPLLKAIGMIMLGLLLGLVGGDVNSGINRFTFENRNLYEGINFVVMAMALFGISEIIRNLDTESSDQTVLAKIASLIPSKDQIKRVVAPIMRGSIVGSALGVLPGGGSILAAFASYAIEKKVSANAKEFGKGAIEGVAGPEAANNAGAQTSFIPMLALGIPGTPTMALMLGAVIIQGVQPGPSMMVRQPELFWGVIVSMWVGNIFLVILNLPMIGIWTQLTRIPYHLLFPGILVFCAIGVFSVNNNTFDVYLMMGLGLLGYVLMKFGAEPAPLLLGFILGPMMEEFLRRALMLSNGDLTVFVTRPISAAILGLAVLALLAIASPLIRTKREDVFSS